MLHNALLLTFVELLLRGVTMLFQRVLVAKIGAAGLGLLQLVLTVGGFAMTLGLAGLRVTAMYLCAEEYGKGSLERDAARHPVLPENRDGHLGACGARPVFPERLRGEDLDRGRCVRRGRCGCWRFFCRSAACARFCPAFSQPATGCASWRRSRPLSGWWGLRLRRRFCAFTRGRTRGRFAVRWCLEARLPALEAHSISCSFCAGHFPAAGKPAVGATWRGAWCGSACPWRSARTSGRDS